MKPKCGLPGCERRHYAKGMCHGHYERNRTGRKLLAPIGPKLPWDTRVRGKCQLPECEHPHYARGLCQLHYNTVRWAEVGEELRCTAHGCLLRHVAKGLCAFHYQMKRSQTQAAIIRAEVPEYVQGREE